MRTVTPRLKPSKKVDADGTLCWRVAPPELASYRVSALYSAAQPVQAYIVSSESKRRIELPATRGYFSAPTNNFERVDNGIELRLAGGESEFGIASMLYINFTSALYNDGKPFGERAAAWLLLTCKCIKTAG